MDLRSRDSTQLELDLETDGPPERETVAGVAESFPKKRIASGALIRDTSGRILFVEPTYKPYLDIPGGIVEANESPLAACLREVREEVGITLLAPRLLEVDWLPAHGVWSDALMFIFDGGILDQQPAAEIRAVDAELTGAEFLFLEDAAPRLRPSMLRRLTTAIEAAEVGTAYAEFGRRQQLDQLVDSGHSSYFRPI